MKTKFGIVALLIAFTASTCFAQEFYKWTDEQGNVHFADSPAGIPPKYRKAVKTGEFEAKPKPKKETAKEAVLPAMKDAKAPVEDQPADLSEDTPQQKLHRYEIPYEPFEGSARRIIINVRFNNSVTAPMILDTGAPGLVISPRLAFKLGIFDNDDGKILAQAGGIGGRVPAVITIMESVQIGDAVDHFVPTTITPSISGSFEGLLGMDFMANYSFTIDTRNKKLILDELEQTEARPGGHDETWWRLTFRDFANEKKLLGRRDKILSQAGDGDHLHRNHDE